MATEIIIQIFKDPEPTTDGSGLVVFDMYAIRDVDGVRKTLLHQDINVPSADLKAALDQATNVLKILGIKLALRDNVLTGRVPYDGWPTPPTTWDLQALNAYADDYDIAQAECDQINDAAQLEADRLHTLVVTTWHLTYPVEFTL